MTNVHALVDIDEAYRDAVGVGAIQRSVAATIQAVLDSGESSDLRDRDLELSIRVTGDAEIRELNRAYRAVDRPTDVLSFALLEGDAPALPPEIPIQLGDVIVSYPYAERQAGELEHSVDMEIAWLVIHGTLQLLGYLHDSEEEAEHMETLETVALRSLGFRKG